MHDEQTERASTTNLATVVPSAHPMALDLLSDHAVDEEYRRQFLRSQSSMTRPFNQHDYYQRA